MKLPWADPWRQVWPWLVAQALAVGLWLTLGPGLKAVHHVDTPSYLKALDGTSLSQDLSSHRTWGYPIFLKVAAACPGGLESAGYLQLGIYLAAVIVLGVVARRYLNSTWLGLAFASPLFYCPLVAGFATALRPELPAAAWCVLTVAFLLAVTLGPRHWWAWAALAFTLALTYHTRPSYLFLLAWVPLAGLALRPSIRPVEARPTLLPWCGRLALAVGLPFMLWCGLRLAVVGQFGLVSFGSINWIGITGSLLTPEVVPELPPRERWLARQILARKAELGLSPHYDFDRLRFEYNKVVFNSALASIRRDPQRPKQDPQAQWMYANERFTSLSLAIVRARPGLYFRWLVDASWFTVKRLARSLWTLLPTVACLLGLAVAWGRQRPSLDPRIKALAAISFLYAAMALALVLAVETPLDRYVFASVLFVPGALLATGFEAVRSKATT